MTDFKIGDKVIVEPRQPTKPYQTLRLAAPGEEPMAEVTRADGDGVVFYKELKKLAEGLQ